MGIGIFAIEWRIKKILMRHIGRKHVLTIWKCFIEKWHDKDGYEDAEKQRDESMKGETE